jgi:hypothetical protein
MSESRLGHGSIPCRATDVLVHLVQEKMDEGVLAGS